MTLDPEQNRIKTELALDGIEYYLPRTESVSRGPTSFDLVESTTAVACASGNVNLVVQLKREIGKLWENIEKAPYKELFNASVSGMYIWRCVRAQRRIDTALDTVIKAKQLLYGRDYSVAIHGNRMAAALVFEKIEAPKFASPTFAFDASASEAMILGETERLYQRLRDSVSQQYGNAIIPTYERPDQVQEPILSVQEMIRVGPHIRVFSKCAGSSSLSR